MVKKVTVKNRIKELRLQRKLSQKELADKVGLSNQSISFYENGKREPKIEAWQKLANFFNVPITYLQGESDIKDKNKFNDFTAFMNSINVSKDPNYMKFSENEGRAFINEETNREFHSLLDVVKRDIGLEDEQELEKDLSKISSYPQMDNINFTVKEIFKIAVKAETGDIKAKTAINKIDKVLNKYLGLDKYDELDNPDNVITVKHAKK